MNGALNSMRQQPGPQDVVGGDQLAQLRNLMLSRAGQMVQAGPPPSQSPETQAALQEYHGVLQQPVDGAAKWWQMAAGFLAPTKTGSFGESLGTAMGGYGKALESEEQQLLKNQMLAAQLKANQGLEADKLQAELYNKSEGKIWDYLKGRDTKSGAKGTILDKAVNAANKYVETFAKQLDPDAYKEEWTKEYLRQLNLYADAYGMQNNMSQTEIDKLREDLARTGQRALGDVKSKKTVDDAVPPIGSMSAEGRKAGGPEGTFPVVVPEVQAGRDLEAFEVLRAEIAAASKAGNREEVEALQKEMQLRFPNGKPRDGGKPSARIVPPNQAELELHGGKKQVEKDIEVGAKPSEVAAKEGTELLYKDFEKVKDLPQTVEMYNQALTAWDKSKSEFGTGGEFVNNAKSFLNNRLGLGLTPDKVANAQEFSAAMDRYAATQLRQTDSQPAVKQLEMLRKAIGTLENDPNAVPKIIHNAMKLAEIQVQSHNARAQAATKSGMKTPFPITLEMPKYIVAIGKHKDGSKVVKYSDGSIKKIGD